MANWNFDAGQVLQMYGQGLERNAAEERLLQQLAAEKENYAALREHQTKLQESSQAFQHGEGGLERDWRTGERIGGEEHQTGMMREGFGHDTSMQNALFGQQRGLLNLEQTFMGRQNDLNRAQQWGLAKAASTETVVDPITGLKIGDYATGFDTGPIPTAQTKYGRVPGVIDANRPYAERYAGAMKPTFFPKPRLNWAGTGQQYLQPGINAPGDLASGFLGMFSNADQVAALKKEIFRRKMFGAQDRVMESLQQQFPLSAQDQYFQGLLLGTQ